MDFLLDLKDRVIDRLLDLKDWAVDQLLDAIETIWRHLFEPVRRQMIRIVLFAVAIGGSGFWLIQTATAKGDEARRDVGSALLSGAVLSTVFVFAERRIEQAVTERQTREQYQLALAMERDLTNRDFSGLNLGGIVLVGRNLSGTRLVQVNLSGADLSNADLSGADLSKAKITASDLINADLSGADLSKAKIRYTYLTGADLSGADLSKAKIEFTYLTSADLSGADLSKARIRFTYLTGIKWDESTIWPKGFTPPESA
jgi:uncharacterized protein YjbI with pentapeptide repeats